MARLTRRSFIKSTLATAATVTIAGTKSSGKVLGANDTIRLAVAGLNGRGGAHIGEFSKMKNVEIVYLVDPDKRDLREAAEAVARRQAARRPSANRTSARCSKTRTWMPSRSPRPTTGTR